MHSNKIYPPVDLSDEKVLQQQRENIARFKVRWRGTFLGLAGFVATIIIGAEFIKPDQHKWVLLLVFIIGIPAILFLVIYYKCPHCGTVPAGVAYGMGDGVVSYTKGMHPFPKRCSCCGFYLAERALSADLQRNKNDNVG